MMSRSICLVLESRPVMKVALPNPKLHSNVITESLHDCEETCLLVVILRKCFKVIHPALCGHIPVKAFTEKRAERSECKAEE